jgi:hypothetical protein
LANEPTRKTDHTIKLFAKQFVAQVP